MTQSKALAMLEQRLEEAIDKWIERESGGDAWGEMGYTSENTSELMAAAAMGVLRASCSTQEYLKREGYWEE